MGPVILSEILKFCNGEATLGLEFYSQDIKEFVYHATGQLAQWVPQLLPRFQASKEVDTSNHFYSARSC